MSRRTKRETGRYFLRTEFGQEIMVTEFTTFIYADSHSGASMIPGLKELVSTNEGYHVNVRGENDYFIVELGQKAVRCDQPLAGNQ